ncbi:apolipoprotein N-acyltransferase [Azorhizobium doebereinerae]|uniref:apolipoprotein N-acyltransferase n=1 Tax=Azorhizobium doebereinerae TaxID=281091 RepID=UPI0003FF477E|nr:apolipoprotein N-acyltransferase [Azorhizobium doebereinerae]
MALASWVRGLAGWRRLAFGMAAGAFSALSTAPYGLWPVLALGFPALVLLIDGAGHARVRGRGAMLRAAAAAGWAFGFGYFLASLWWIGDAFLVEADVFAWLLPVAVLALPAGLALFMALGAVLARLLWSPGPARLCAFTAAFTVSEWLRGHVLTGFPWNTFGYGPAATLELAQGAAVVGLWGLTFFTLLLFSTPVLLLRAGGFWRRAGWPLAALAVLAGAYGAGAYRLAVTPARFLETVHLRIMQPALPQGEKFAYDKRQTVLSNYLELSTRKSILYPKGLEDVSLLIWPESAFPFIYEREPWAKARIAEALPENVTLVTGAARLGLPPPGQSSSFYNSIRVMNARGEVLDTADKVHLVPFGEYLPFQAFLEWLGLEQLTRVRGGFSAGTTLRPLPLPGAPAAAPLICYEVIFPGAVLPVGPRPGFLLNLTNDAWFGDTPGPYQHFLQARLRTIEEGLPLVRAANTGISAIVDPVGRIVAALDLGERGILDADLPAALANPPPGTWLSGVVLGLVTLLTSLVAVCAIRRHHTRLG